MADVKKVFHEVDALLARFMSSTTATVNVEHSGKVVKKSAPETLRGITAVWKKFVWEMKKLNDKMNGVC